MIFDLTKILVFEMNKLNKSIIHFQKSFIFLFMKWPLHKTKQKAQSTKQKTKSKKQKTKNKKQKAQSIKQKKWSEMKWKQNKTKQNLLRSCWCLMKWINNIICDFSVNISFWNTNLLWIFVFWLFNDKLMLIFVSLFMYEYFYF
jgi:hypothetical protein